jgi:hypothetical protein
VSRQRANELDLSENELVIARDELDRLHDDLYAMACAVEDTERDMAAWLMDAARPLRDREMPAPSTPR